MPIHNTLGCPRHGSATLLRVEHAAEQGIGTNHVQKHKGFALNLKKELEEEEDEENLKRLLSLRCMNKYKNTQRTEHLEAVVETVSLSHKQAQARDQGEGVHAPELLLPSLAG